MFNIYLFKSWNRQYLFIFLNSYFNVLCFRHSLTFMETGSVTYFKSIFFSIQSKPKSLTNSSSVLYYYNYVLETFILIHFLRFLIKLNKTKTTPVSSYPAFSISVVYISIAIFLILTFYVLTPCTYFYV